MEKEYWNIQGFLEELEKERDIKILIAVESGSREWGMSSKDSDYDVRGVFCYPSERYLDLEDHEKDIVLMHGPIDLHLMELKKFMKLLLTSNPTTIEWLQSKTWYKDGLEAEDHKLLSTFLANDWDPIALFLHYKGMAKENYLKYLKTRQEPTVKRYLYAYRGVLAGLIARESILPPIDINQLLEMAPIAPGKKDTLRGLIALKKDGHEKMEMPNLPEFDPDIESFIQEKGSYAEKKIIDRKPYREFVIRVLKNTNER